jgi:hypothetical protein
MFSIEETDDKYCVACNCKELEILETDNFKELQKIKNEERIKSQENTGEYKVLNEIQNFLEEFNIKVWRECIPDQCVTWKLPYSVDMIFEIPTYGLIGLEGKNISTHGQGSKYAEAYLQIRDKYSNKTYFNGKKVRRWCIYANANYNPEKYSYEIGRIDCFIKHLFNKLGISYLTFNKKIYSSGHSNKLVLDPTTKNTLKIEDSSFNGKIITGADKDNFLDYGRDIK